MIEEIGRAFAGTCIRGRFLQGSFEGVSRTKKLVPSRRGGLEEIMHAF